jgi:hypothetical protein
MKDSGRRFVFGAMVAAVGLVFSAACFVHALANPGVYNGVDGLRGAFLCAGTLPAFVVSLIVLAAGLALCGFEAYRSK